MMVRRSLLRFGRKVRATDKRGRIMSDEGFEKGLKLLLNQAYDRPEPDEIFRNQLLQRLRGKQMQVRARRRRKIITLCTSCATAAAAAAFVIGVLPLNGLQPVAAPEPGVAAAPQPGAAQPFATGSHYRPLPPSAIKIASHGDLRTAPFADFVSAPGGSRSVEASVAPVLAGTVTPAQITHLDGQYAHAINAIEIRTGTGDWSALKADSKFMLKKGMQIRTPVGTADPVTVAIRNGTMLMLDGMSRIAVGEKDLRLQDGRAVVSLTHSKLGVELHLAKQELALQPGAMAFLRVEDGDDYAQGGAPAPVMVLLKGQALPLQADGAVRSDANVLSANKVYELYNTGTGRYPSREIGSYESQQRFQPMINAITASNEYN